MTTGMAGMPAAGSSVCWLALLPIALPGTLYAVGVLRLVRRGDRWPGSRTAAAATGLAGLAAVFLPPLADGGDSFVVHVLGHLLLAMAAPLLLALSAPVTLALRTLPPRGRRTLLAACHSRPAAVLTWWPVAVLADVAGMYVFYLTPVFGLAHVHPGWSALVHVHMALAGFLLGAVVAGPDPLPRRPGTTTALIAVLLVGAAHATLAKLMYAHHLPAGAGTAAQVELGAQLLFYGGDVVELATAVAVLATWYRREGRALRRAARADAQAVPDRARAHPVT